MEAISLIALMAFGQPRRVRVDRCRAAQALLERFAC
jgi:hypothetical protein